MAPGPAEESMDAASPLGRRGSEDIPTAASTSPLSARTSSPRLQIRAHAPVAQEEVGAS